MGWFGWPTWMIQLDSSWHGSTCWYQYTCCFFLLLRIMQSACNIYLSLMIHIKDVEWFECVVFFIIFILSTLWLQNLDGFVDNEKQSIRRPVGRAKLQFDPKTVIGLQPLLKKISIFFIWLQITILNSQNGKNHTNWNVFKRLKEFCSIIDGIVISEKIAAMI